ncbi:hypothetical protein AB870_13250 [Pandoraea faecigallinarum]|uniref:Uncharacterized protein n=1 Tax=Pandoraea faecigallinarum TaxID=656179 RepID=A0A0H3WW73_9BURK|nr:hypothetical protein [Pandoraea faecigallinarum]AKM30863.1 hypothetical protein AB870_13250 [Pandoraea faecigallinarum]
MRIRPATPSQASEGAVRSRVTTAWPAALALMLVANLVSPATGAIPKTSRQCAQTDDVDGTGGRNDCDAAVSPQPDAIAASVDVVAQPVSPQMTIKREYSLQDVLRSLGRGSEPFRHFGDSAADVYALLTGHAIDDRTREAIQQRTHMVDVATGLIPEVAMLRLPSEVMEVVADERDGKPVSAERVIAILQSADPRVLARPLGSALRPGAGGRRMAQGLLADADPDAGSRPVMRTIEHSPAKTFEGVERKVASGALEFAIEHADMDDGAKAELRPGVSDDLPPMYIAGEDRYLEGYAQQIAPERLPPSGDARLVVIDGQRYLRGEAGYYLATRAPGADHWLIDSVRRTLAQVPVTYDPHSGRWEAHAPLRVCGGGCGNSRVTTPDSIALNRHDVDAVLSHLRDDDVQNAILGAYAEVSRMKLMRTNRPDLRKFRDNSIIRNRDAIRAALEQVPPNASLFEQQRLAAFLTASHYRLNPGTEAFCQENAEILFHFLIEGGIPGDCLRMITVRPKYRAPHALVLYTESDELIDALELATPVEYDGTSADGITGTHFAGLVMGARDTTVLLDPWSRVKAVGFAMSKDPQETGHVLDAAFADIGHRPGESYTVSLTRPLGPRRGSLRRFGSRGSMGSAGTASSTMSARGSTRGSTGESTAESSSGTGGAGESSGYGSSSSPDSASPAGLPPVNGAQRANGA